MQFIIICLSDKFSADFARFKPVTLKFYAIISKEMVQTIRLINKHQEKLVEFSQLSGSGLWGLRLTWED